MTVKTSLSWPGLVQALLSQARLAARLVREPRVPLFVKALLAAAGLYLISPLDFIPDVLPILGQIDDLALVMLALQAFIHLCPSPAVLHHRTAISQGRRFSPMKPGDDFIEAEWRPEK